MILIVSAEPTPTSSSSSEDAETTGLSSTLFSAFRISVDSRSCLFADLESSSLLWPLPTACLINIDPIYTDSFVVNRHTTTPQTWPARDR